MTARPALWISVGALALSTCTSPGVTTDDEGDELGAARGRMIEHDLRGAGIRDERVLAAMARVRREEFVPASQRSQAYADRPLPIGQGQTISQPYVVALMTEKLELQAGERVLEIGTGSGYQAAVLAEMGCEVYSIEILPALADEARQRLDRLGYRVHVRAGDGFDGWPEEAPFDAVIITAAAPEIPPLLVEQLREGGRIILPRGGGAGQSLMLGTKTANGLQLRSLGGVAFVPMTGKVRE